MAPQDGPFTDFIREVAADPRFRHLCPISEVRINHRDYEEMVLRFYAYLHRYRDFNKRVDEFLDEYLEHMNESGFDRDGLRETFENMLNFVQRFFTNGFKKAPNNFSVPRIRFESISVGVALAQQEVPELVPASMCWLASDEFKVLTRSDASNSRPKVINRIHFVRITCLAERLSMTNSEVLAIELYDLFRQRCAEVSRYIEFIGTIANNRSVTLAGEIEGEILPIQGAELVN